MPETFADVLGHYVQRSRYSAPQVAALSGLSRRTVANWLGGVALKPQQWQGVVKVAAALKLNEPEASRLLEAAGHSPIAELRQAVTGEDLDLLAPWPPPEQAPFQAVADLPYFVGREAAMHELEQILQQGQQVAICNLHGMGGVGKTSLAAHLAYRLRAQFPDGVLWARLDTTDTMTILSAFADTYGKDVSDYRDVESRSAVVRNLLVGKRVLVVLDNAENSGQVRPLLPPTTGKTAVLLTTRYDLAVADQMHRFPIESFDPASGESLSLFSHFLGQPTIQRWQAELQAIADLLGHLPLAIAIAAGQMAYGRVPIPHFLAQLQQSEQRLDALIREDRSVRLSFDTSFQDLEPELQRFFAALGAFGGDDFDVTAVAYVTETTTETAQDGMDQLIHLSLVQHSRLERYRLHPLLCAYAREKLEGERAYNRMVAYFVAYATSRDHEYVQLNQELGNILAALDTAETRRMNEDFINGIIALAYYLELRGYYSLCERYLNQAQDICQTNGNETHLVHILFHLGNLSSKMGKQEQAENVLREASNLAQKHQDYDLHLKTLSMLGSIAKSRGNIPQARERWQMGLQLAEQINHPRMRIVFRINLGYLASQVGEYLEAECFYLEAQQLANITGLHGDGVLKAVIVSNLGAQAFTRGNYQQAEAYYNQSLSIARQINDRKRICWVLANFGTLAFARGKLKQAKRYYQQSLEMARRDDNPRNQAYALLHLGQLFCEYGDYTQAEYHLQESLSIARLSEYQEIVTTSQLYLGAVAVRQRHFEKANNLLEQGMTGARKQHLLPLVNESLYLLGLLRLEEQMLDEAERLFQQAFHVAQERGMKEQTAVCLFGLAKVAAARNQMQEAQRTAQTSLALFEQIGHRSAAEVRHWLDLSLV